jgi:hypothetical protein
LSIQTIFTTDRAGQWTLPDVIGDEILHFDEVLAMSRPVWTGRPLPGIGKCHSHALVNFQVVVASFRTIETL